MSMQSLFLSASLPAPALPIAGGDLPRESGRTGERRLVTLLDAGGSPGAAAATADEIAEWFEEVLGDDSREGPAGATH